MFARPLHKVTLDQAAEKEGCVNRDIKGGVLLSLSLSLAVKRLV